MKIAFSTGLLALGLAWTVSAEPEAKVNQANQMTHEEVLTSSTGVVLQGPDKIQTSVAFRPPVEITIVAKTDSTNLRLSYAADEVIFNWEENPTQLRVDGGPAAGQHKSGAGHIPPNEYVTVRWVVTPGHQAIYVGDELRFEHSGDYSSLEKPVAVFPELGSTVTVKSIKVKQLGKVVE